MSRKVPVPQELLAQAFLAAASNTPALASRLAIAIRDAAEDMDHEGLSAAALALSDVLGRERARAQATGLRWWPAAERTSALDVVLHLRRRLADLNGIEHDDLQTQAEKLLEAARA